MKFTVRVKTDASEKTVTLALTAKDNAAKKFKAALGNRPEILSVEWTHRHYVKDAEYIPHGEDIENFLTREIAKPIIHWEDSPQLGYEILPNKYFYRYQAPTPAKELLDEFWRLEKEAEKMLGRADSDVMNTHMETKSSELDWLGEVPADWSVYRIKRVMSKVDYGISESTQETGRFAVLKMGQFQGGEIDFSALDFVDEVSEGLLLESGDLLYNRTNSPDEVGKAAIFRGSRQDRVTFASYLVRLRTNHRASPYFLNYLLNCDGFLSYARKLAIPSVQQSNLNSTRYCQIPIPVPRSTEQQRIAKYLDASCAAIDAAMAAKRRQLEVLEGVRRQIIQKAVTRGIEEHPVLRQTGYVWMNDVPVNWDLVSLKRVSEIQTGLTLGKVYEGVLIERPYLRVANVQDGHLNLKDVTTIEVPEQVADRVELRPGDVLMTEGGDLDKLGRGTVWSGEIPDCLHQNHIFAIRCFKHKLLPDFLAYLTASRYGRDYFEATGKRTTNLASTNSTKVGLFPIPRPPITEQKEICQFLDAKLSEIAQVVKGIDAQIATLTAYRRSLIHECVTGQRSITEADLTKIRARSALEVGPRPRRSPDPPSRSGY
jgi:type I restriction enzyme S subunit